LDTSVLWPSLQRDFLLSLGIEGMYRPVWSSAILEELEHHEAVKLVARGEQKAEAARRACRLVAKMRSAFSDAEVQGWEGLEGRYGLPDPDDEHVVAAAVVAGAGAIVTHNVRDFPADRIPSEVQVVRPNDFACNTVSVDPTRALTAVEAVARRSGRHGPRLTVDDVLDHLASRYHMNAVVEMLRLAE